MSKNIILKLFNFAKIVTSEDNYDDYDINVIDVVNNFDLSFCEIWYNGSTIQSNDFSNILQLKGKLKNDYVKAYENGNGFILNRIQKYLSRNFLIEIKCTTTNINLKKNRYKNVTTPELWVYKQMYTTLFRSLHINNKIDFII